MPTAWVTKLRSERLLPGVLGNDGTADDATDGLLEEILRRTTKRTLAALDLRHAENNGRASQ